MPTNVGKKFEERFAKDWKNSFQSDESFISRIPDQVSKRKGSSKNLCDFFAFDGSRLYIIEVKSHLGNTFPFDNLRQYDKLIEEYYHNYKNIVIGVVIWFRDHDKVVYAPIREIEKMKNDNKKSVNIKMLNENEYKLYDIPSVKLRSFLKSDYSCMKEVD